MLNPKDIKKFETQLPIPPVLAPKVVKDHWGNVRHEYEIDVSAFDQQILPEGFPKTRVFGYGGLVKDGKRTKYTQLAPGPTFEAIRGIPIKVKWINNLDVKHFLPVDGTLHWANPNDVSFPAEAYPIPFNPETRRGIPEVQKPIPIVPHLHGGENEPRYDGHPDAWFTKNKHETGKGFVTNEFLYQNTQPPTTLWYHDHTLGMTRLNVYAGMAGFYLLSDPNNPLTQKLPSGEFDIPLAIQDRSFTDDGQLLELDNVGINPEINPYWTPEFFGNTIMVNGKVWPNLNVKRHQYRFRILNGSNARFYRLSLPFEGVNLSFTQIASDGGFLPRPVEMTELLIAPGERAEILVDFSKLPVGTTLVLKNDAATPFNPSEPPLDPNDPTTEIMQITVIKSKKKSPKPLPAKLNNIPVLKQNGPTRILTLNEVLNQEGDPLMLLLNGQPWEAPVSEKPLVGSTEEWDLVNLTVDTHPIHLHLVQFQVVSRQAFDSEQYLSDWLALNGGEMPFNHPTQTLPLDKKYLIGNSMPPRPNEEGWKDTVQANPGEITKIRMRFAPTAIQGNAVKPGENEYPFNPGSFPGYVWHCHILEHEDNEMMRPYQVKVPSTSPFKWIIKFLKDLFKSGGE